MIALATGLLVRDERLLMVASRYANHPQPLWNLPGGRQQPGELLAETVAREVFEETRLHVKADDVAYVSESYDGATHYLNVTFNVILLQGARSARDDRGEDDHVAAVEWVPISEVEERIVVAVVREPLLAYLRGDLSGRYAGFHRAGITIEWPQGSR
ncbi:MAG: NUDIX domain-containing protein [Candidatus Cybelea sp.]